MFYPEEVEREILYNTNTTKPYDNKPLIRSYTSNPKVRRAVGGSDGVSTLKPAKLLYSSSMSGGSKKPSVWNQLVKNTMQSTGLSMVDAVKHIKKNNLY